MKKEHAYGHTITDLIIEFENVTKEELWDLYKLTKKKLDKETTDHKETILAYDVLGDEFNEMESDLKDEIKDLKKRLAELEDAIEQSVGTGKDALWWEIPWVENQTIQQAIQNSRARKGEAMG